MRVERGAFGFASRQRVSMDVVTLSTVQGKSISRFNAEAESGRIVFTSIGDQEPMSGMRVQDHSFNMCKFVFLAQ
jgi:hypothetical protein